jgi:hypothetical protein
LAKELDFLLVVYEMADAEMCSLGGALEHFLRCVICKIVLSASIILSSLLYCILGMFATGSVDEVLLFVAVAA